LAIAVLEKLHRAMAVEGEQNDADEQVEEAEGWLIPLAILD
jgi:hypothetical protein